MSYHDEQETLESLKAWWARWGNIVTWATLVVMIALAAWSGWNYWQRRQTAAASTLYGEFQQAAQTSNTTDPEAHARITRIASDMESDFGRTPYAQMTALEAATVLYNTSDVAGAKAQLQWVIDHASDNAYRQIARIRMAGVLLDEKSYDAGLKVLADTPPAAFTGLWADRRGDLLAAQGKTDDARSAYRLALASLGDGDPSTRQLVQFKLDALGS